MAESLRLRESLRNTRTGALLQSGENQPMNVKKYFLPLGCVALIVAASYFYGWRGLAAATGGLVMWLLMHFNRMIQVLKRARDRPMGYVGSSVMLNAKLKPAMTMLHVVAMTKALGERQSEPNEQPELYRWTDGTQSHVTCEFQDGKLKKWTLWRPIQVAESANDAVTGPTP
jgi:hypothetical protein